MVNDSNSSAGDDRMVQDLTRRDFMATAAGAGLLVAAGQSLAAAGPATAPQAALPVALKHAALPPALKEAGVKTPMVIRNVRIFDGERPELFPGQVRIENGKISAVAIGSEKLSGEGAQIVDGRGATLMPGMVDGHAHLAFPFSIDRSPPREMGNVVEIVLQSPPEYLMFYAMHNASVMIDHGFTSAYSAGAGSMSMDAALKSNIDRGILPGPRLVSASFEGDASLVSGASGEGLQVNDPDDVRKHVNNSADHDVKVAKFILSGPSFFNDVRAMYSDSVLAVARETAEARGVWLSGHSRPTEAIRQGLRYGFRVLYHCDGFDEETLDMAAARKNEIFIGPTIGGLAVYLGRNRQPKMPMMDQMFEVYHRNIEGLRKRGIRMVTGGDYGFDMMPHGTYANDLVGYVKHFGMPSHEVLRMATRNGGEQMDLPIGLVRQGYLADLLLVNGDPLKDISVLATKSNIRMVMKGGAIHRLDG